MLETYIISIIAILLAYWSKYDKFRWGLPLAFIVITSFLSLGYEWGNDVSTYERVFERYTNSEYSLFDFQTYEYLNDKSEFGWVLINQLCGGIGFYGMRAILFSFENLVIYLLIKRVVPSNYYWFAVFIYVVNPHLMILSSSMMRQWLAMCIVLFAFLYLEKRKSLVYILLIVIASTIHRSSLICLPLVILPNLTYSYKRKSFIWMLWAFVVYYLLSGLLVQHVVGLLQSEEIYSNYTDEMYSSGVGILTIIQFAIYIIMFTNIQAIEKDRRIYIAVLMAFGLILPFYNYSGLASRLGYYFTVFTIVAYPLFFKQSSFNSYIKLTLALVIIVITIYNNVMFFTNPMWYLHFGDYNTIVSSNLF